MRLTWASAGFVCVGVWFWNAVDKVLCWCVSVENENHCDFVKLREMLIRTNMEDLRETTHYRHYELYRRHKLEDMGFSDADTRRLVRLF